MRAHSGAVVANQLIGRVAAPEKSDMMGNQKPENIFHGQPLFSPSLSWHPSINQTRCILRVRPETSSPSEVE
jgi:hypothetical protein